MAAVTFEDGRSMSTMRRLAFLAVPLASLALVGAASGAKRPLALDPNLIGLGQCTPQGSGAKAVVDVTFVLANYGDAGYASQWAIDTVHRHLRIFKHSDGTYCAHIDDAGSKFVTRAGPSPGATGYVSAGVEGTFSGGYVSTDITGKFKPGYPTKGDLGTFDAKCDKQFNCTGKYPTWLSYFKNPKANSFSGWGWLYDAGSHGSWLDQQVIETGKNGDITG